MLKFPPSSLLKTGIAVSVALGIVAGTTACSHQAADAAANSGAPATNAASGDAKPALTVTLVSAHNETWAKRLAVSGNVQAWQESLVSTEVGGLRLADVLVNVGDMVHQGQLLARLNDESVSADVAQQEAAVAEAEANLAQAKLSAERAHALDASGAMSSQDVVQYDTSAKTSAAKLASAQALLASQKIRLRNTRIVAVDDGVISARSATLGAVVASGTELFRLIRQNRLEWRAELRSEQLPGVQPGQLAELHTPSGQVVKGKIRQIAPTVDTTARNALVYVDLPAAAMSVAGLKTGMFVSGELLLSESPALALPETAVVVRDGYSYVMKLGPDSHVQQTRLTLGRRQNAMVEVLSGLQAGDRVVATGAGFLNDADLVKVVDKVGGGAAAASDTSKNRAPTKFAKVVAALVGGGIKS